MSDKEKASVKEARKSSVFEELYSVNMNSKTEQKNGLTYLSWASAWAAVKAKFPDASYSIIMDAETDLPYKLDPKTGYMVFTSVTIGGETLPMWLPVMDATNAAMKDEPYEVSYKAYGKVQTRTVQAATMTDINKTIMRCLAKNLAMFGLGLYVFEGEDLPQDISREDEVPDETSKPASAKKETKAETKVQPKEKPGQPQPKQNLKAGQTKAEPDPEPAPEAEGTGPDGAKGAGKAQAPQPEQPDRNAKISTFKNAEQIIASIIAKCKRKNVPVVNVLGDPSYSYAGGDLGNITYSHFEEIMRRLDFSPDVKAAEG